MITWICPYCSTENNSNEDICPCCGFKDRKKYTTKALKKCDINLLKNKKDIFRQTYEVNIANSYTSILTNTFNFDKSITKINIPESITDIDVDAFYKCDNLYSIVVHKNNIEYSSIDGVLFNKDKTKLIKYPANKGDILYRIPNTVKTIGAFAFYGCKNLIKVTFPKSVTQIEFMAFARCQKLHDIIIPENVIDIQENTFDGCKSLEHIIIPNGVKNIGFRAFADCKRLDMICIPNSVINIEGNAFEDCNSLLIILIENPSCYISYLGNNLSKRLTIYGDKNSTAEKYAQEYGIKFE